MAIHGTIEAAGDCVSAKKMDHDPPFMETYKKLFDTKETQKFSCEAKECELPVIDLRTNHSRRAIATAATNWGFFQVLNHGIPDELLKRVHSEQMKLFHRPFDEKCYGKLLGLSNDCYRWGTPTAVSLRQLCWSEAYHIPLVPVSELSEDVTRRTFEEFAMALSHLAQQLAEALAEELGHEANYFKQNCTCSTCFLRLNHYPPCPAPNAVHGMVPHTDSDFLTILYQDQVGGLQLMKGGKWITVNPNSGALIVNIGDLFEAWSNGVYKSVEHRVMSNANHERFSAAFFLCPSHNTTIQSPSLQPAIYRKFTFEEYRQQVRDDVKTIGHKVGLPRFLYS